MLAIRMTPKLVVFFLFVGLAPLGGLGWWTMNHASSALMQKSYSQLQSVREIKKAAVERYFQSIENQILTFSEDKTVIDALRDFRKAFPAFIEENSFTPQDLQRMKQELATYYAQDFSNEYRKQNGGAAVDALRYLEMLDDDSIALQYAFIRANEHPLGQKHLLDTPGDASAYSRLHAALHPIVRSYLEKFGYYDIFLCDPETGDIIYSVFKELDYSTSLKDGPFADTNFGEAFSLANQATDKDFVALVDFKKYPPSYEAPASFIASPVFDGQKKIGVALFQMPIDRLNAIMGERAGLGETGETYLVGPDGLMRSDSYLDPEHHSMVASFKNPQKGSVDTAASRDALAGTSGTEVIIDYNGNPVLSAYAPLDILGHFQWALLSEIDEAEVLAPIEALRLSVLYFALGAAVLVALFAFFVARSITKPIKRAMNFSLAVAKGDFSQKLNISSKDEVGDLAKAMKRIPETLENVAGAINTMADEIVLGKVNYRTRSQDFESAYATLLVDANNVADSLVDFLESVPLPIMTIDREKRLLYANAAAKTMTGDAQLPGKTCTQVLRSKECGSGNCPCHSAIKNLQMMSRESIIRPADKDMHVISTFKPMYDKSGALVGAFGVLVDQSEIKGAQRKLQQVATMANEISESLASATDQIAAQVEEANNGTEIQKQRTAETATAMEQMNATVLEVAQNASLAAENADAARTMAREGAQVVGQMIQTITQVHEQTDHLRQNMAGLGEQAENIGKVMSVISDIADQTNLLALNAAIEAARAGEAGRGFAVVADEVRKLAEKTVAATKEVGDAIASIQDSARTSIQETEKASDMVSNATEMASESGRALQEILELSDSTADQVRSIATASEQQSATSDQVAKATDEINRITMETANSMEQSASAVNELTQLAQRLNSIIKEMLQ